MRLLVDDRWFGATGIGRYAKEIIQRTPSGDKIEYLCKTWAIKNPVSPLLLGLEINRRGADIFWSPGFMPPVSSKTPYVITIHDLIHLRYGNVLQRIYYNQVIRPLLKNAAFILTVSEYSKREILQWSGLPEKKVISVYNAVSSGYTLHGIKYEPGYPYLLYVGNQREHKNLQRLLVAFSRARLADEMKLVFTGDATRGISELAHQLRISDRLVFLGHVSEGDLPSVYRGAIAVMLVSLYEGFGIPVIEAMACGVPVLASNVTALPEVAGDAACFVDPLSIDEIRSGIEMLVNDSELRERLVRKGYARSQEFSWDSTADQVWKMFENAAA